MTTTSLLRYPGGKSRFTRFIWEAITASGENIGLFAEPFCGGAGVAISLLETERVEQIALNDADPLVASLWKVVFGKSCNSRRDINWLIQIVETAELSVNEWRRLKNSEPTSLREAAWKCLFLNRTSFNGIIHKSGPIGGWEQRNRTVDVRFNREKLANRLRELYEYRHQVEHVGCSNWRRFSARFQQRNDTYLYLDPPYYHRAEQLYKHLFDKKQHRLMRNHLIELQTPWLLSYDDAPEVRALYGNLEGVDCRVVDQTYSTHPMGGASFIGRELLFSNREFPVVALETPIQPHVGITILGRLNAVEPTLAGPLRTPIAQQPVPVPAPLAQQLVINF